MITEIAQSSDDPASKIAYILEVIALEKSKEEVSEFRTSDKAEDSPLGVQRQSYNVKVKSEYLQE